MSGSTRRTGSAARPAASVAFLDKPDGLSSFAALGALKRAVGTRKVGHTGTLDPFATGLLVALVGPATRAARYFNGLPKRYSARFVFGTQTDTDDATGAVIRATEPPSADSLAGALPRFRGTITQLPPAYSAVHVNGRRAHEIARSGETPDLCEREVTVARMEVVATEEAGGFVEYADVDIACSAGTYVRSIARDLGVASGSAAHVSMLRRTEVGPFTVDGALAPAEITPDALCDLALVLTRLPGFIRLEIPEWVADRVADGKQLTAADLSTADPRRIVLTHNGITRAIGHLNGERFAYEMVVPRGGPGD